MAVLDNTRLAGPTSDTGRTAGILASIFARFATWNDARITRNALSALSDRELDDIGLMRGDIEEITRRRG